MSLTYIPSFSSRGIAFCLLTTSTSTEGTYSCGPLIIQRSPGWRDAPWRNVIENVLIPHFKTPSSPSPFPSPSLPPSLSLPLPLPHSSLFTPPHQFPFISSFCTSPIIIVIFPSHHFSLELFFHLYFHYFHALFTIILLFPLLRPHSSHPPPPAPLLSSPPPPPAPLLSSSTLLSASSASLLLLLSIPHSVGVRVFLNGLHNQSFIFSEDIDILDTLLESLSRLQE